MAEALYILDTVHPLLKQKMLAAIAATEAAGVPVVVRSGFRSYAQQVALWNARASNPYPVAQPGLSPHEWGVAVDARPVIQTTANWQVLWNNAAAQGLVLGKNFNTPDNVHFELAGYTHGSATQPGLAQYGIYAMPGSGAAVAALGTNAGGTPALPVGAANPAPDAAPFGLDNDTITIIAVGLLAFAVISYLEG